MANKYTKTCSTSVVPRKMLMKTTMRYHYIPTRMVKSKNSDTTKS